MTAVPPRDLSRPSRMPPWRPAAAIGPDEPRCVNCAWYERPASPLGLDGLSLNGFDEGQKKDLAAYVADTGYCTLHPPATGQHGTATQPLTHASYRCSGYAHPLVVAAHLQAQLGQAGAARGP